MTALLRTLLSLALSGSVLILLLLLLLPRLRARTSRRWQYYIWLAPALCAAGSGEPDRVPPGGGQRRPGTARRGGTGR